MAFGPGGELSEPALTPIVIESEKTATLAELVAKLKSERVVYVGETHTAFGDHMLQLDVLRGMAAQPGELALGVEWIQARFQPVVDSYLAGQIDEPDFLRLIEYYDRWRFDYRLYRPIIAFAVANGIPIVALNASREVTTEVSREGIKGLPEELRKELPDDYDFSDQAYSDRLREMFRRHPANGAVFERFLEAQLTWDETMAQNVSSYLAGNPSRRMLVLAGKGHISGRSGIPNRVTRRTGIEGKTIGSYQPSSRLFNSADFMVLATERYLPPAGVMRVLLDDRGEGVFIKGFTDDSPAKKAGMRDGDRLLSIDGKQVGNFVDIKLAMMDKAPGHEVVVAVSRKGFFGGEKNRELSFSLVSSGSPH